MTKEEVLTALGKRSKEFKYIQTVARVANEMQRETYVVGGYVRDIILNRKSKDIDFVCIGSGIELAERVAETLGKYAHLSVFQTYGTAQVKHNGIELEFVGARKESYPNPNSRNPVVEVGSITDDQERRDFTVNAMALSLQEDSFCELVDPFNGVEDIKAKIIRTPLEPIRTFSDDPLRMMRAVRFATQLNFDIHPITFKAIQDNLERIEIIKRERILDELMKIMASANPARGIRLLDECGLLQYVIPRLCELKGVDVRDGRGHKDNFLHTLQVLEQVSAKSNDIWLRWAALFHDIGKIETKAYDAEQGWTFHQHNMVGLKMLKPIFRQMKFPLNEHMKFILKMIELHMRPIALVEDIVTDSAVRRLLFDAGDDIDALMILCESDITSKNPQKVKRLLANFALVRTKLIEIEEKDRVRNFQPPVSGEEIMEIFGLTPSRPVGDLKAAIKEAILDGVIPNEYAPALEFMYAKAAEMGLKPVKQDKEG